MTGAPNSQANFGAALLDADAARPDAISDGHGGPAAKRFDVYRNNVAVSLADALETSFPVVRALVGDEFFRALAGAALRQYPPRSARMAEYGQDFPGFLADFPPVAQLPYLPDVARIENAMRRAYHAADIMAFGAGDLGQMGPEVFERTCFSLVPAVTILRSAYPFATIWLNHQPGAEQRPMAGAEDCLICRPEFDPWVHALPMGGFEFLSRMDGKTPLGAALAGLPDGFDFSQMLTLCLEQGILHIPAWATETT